MGHIRLQVSRSRKWRDVVELLALGADVAQVASATLKTAESAFAYVNNDLGYVEAVSLMTHLALAASHEKPLEYLRSQGINIPDNTSLPGVAVALTQSLDNHSLLNGGHSDLGALAQRALVDAVIGFMEPRLRQQSFFNMQIDDTQQAIRALRTPNEFGKLSRGFFARLTDECLKYFLSQNLATHLGEGQRFATTNQMAQFEEALSTHCRETSAVVEQFSSDWFSKHRYEEKGSISRESLLGFASFALTKMKDALKAGAKADGRKALHTVR